MLMVLGIAAGCKKGKKSSVSFEDSVELTPITASIRDKNMFMYNPDRGFRTDVVIRIQDLVPYVNNEGKIMNQIASTFNIYFGKLQEPCHLAFAYIYFTPWYGKYDVDKSNPSLINIMEKWDEQAITKDWLEEQGIIYDPNWFLDDDGEEVERTCYEFIRDHLGYKIVAEKIAAKAEGGKISVNMSLKNYGFSAAFNLSSGFAILNEKYEPITEIEVGDPSTWYSHDPENWKSTTVPTYELSGELEQPLAEGEYYIAFFLRNSAGVGAQLSNDVALENEHNILCDFEVKCIRF